MSSPSLAARAARAVRDGWLMAGSTLLLLLVLEGGCRLHEAIEAAAETGGAEPVSPFDETDWAADYWIGHEQEEAVRWAPYVYRRNPTFAAPHATVDDDGHRVTPLPVPPTDPRPAVRVFFLGGSTTFGWFQRAEHTIPAEAARRIQARLGTDARVEVTNFGVPGHTFTQEILELMLQLRAGARPDVVVFYDGINDVMATVQNGRAGLPQNERNREVDFQRGRRVDARPAGLLSDMGIVAAASIEAAMRRLRVAARLRRYVGDAPGAPPDADALAEGIARMHAENARLVEELAEGYDFEAIYVWQPALLSSGKPLTERERWLQRDQGDPFVDTVRRVHRQAPALLRTSMRPVAGPRFVDATDLFARDAGEIYVDLFGHTYERANPPIVDALMPALGEAVTRALARPADP